MFDELPIVDETPRGSSVQSKVFEFLIVLGDDTDEQTIAEHRCSGSTTPSAFA
ncbi:hypothetical protein ACWC4D_39970 [Streptomyces sp. NPDC001288]|uniref:hypothetical protein n=1 Tax=Streptomyces sp. NPDC001297 TaxID=3364559 RepID=UPI00369E7FB6